MGTERPIVVHQLNATGVSPAEFIRMVAATGCKLVTLFTFDGGDQVPRSNTGLSYPQPVTPQNKAETLAALAETGVAVDGIEFFPLTEEVNLDIYVPALAMGRELGAKRASSHLFIRDDALVVDKLGKLCDLAKREGLTLSSEFCPMTAGNPSLERSIWLVDQLGRSDFGMGVDTLHFVRSGGSLETLAGLAPRYFGIAQICDAIGTHTSQDYIADVHNREVPGKGDLPLREILSAVPQSMQIEIEVPAAHRRAAGVSAEQHVREVVEGTRAIAKALTPSR
jgi:sugar phosphate isomerase/epimerase